MGKLENDVRIKLDDDLFGWVNRESAALDLPRRLWIVRQLKFVRKVHAAMKQESEITIKRFPGVFGGRPGLAGATPDYVIEGNYVPARGNITYTVSACNARCPFAHLGRKPPDDSPAVLL